MKKKEIENLMHEIFNLKFFHKLEVSSLLINTLKYIHHLLQYN